MTLAWHTAALPLMKRFPPLRELLGKSPAPARASAPEAMLAAARAWDGRINGGR